jgi:chemotaxis protein MotB
MHIKYLCICCLASLVSLSMMGCVKRKLYHAEQIARKSAEVQVSVLSKELFDRKKEAANLIGQIADLSKQTGRLDKEIGDLQAELAKRTQTMGASTERLVSEKSELDKRYQAAVSSLEKKEAQLLVLQKEKQHRDETLKEELGVLDMKLVSYLNNGAILLLADDHIELTIADKLLYNPDGLALNRNSNGVLGAVAEFLAERPAYRVQIYAHVDNQLPPRNKEISDTWAFAQVRALNVVRSLVSNFNVNAYMLAPVAMGEFQPLSTNSTVEGRAENRRTVFHFYPKFQNSDY